MHDRENKQRLSEQQRFGSSSFLQSRKKKNITQPSRRHGGIGHTTARTKIPVLQWPGTRDPGPGDGPGDWDDGIDVITPDDVSPDENIWRGKTGPDIPNNFR